MRSNFVSAALMALALTTLMAAVLSARYRVLADWTARSRRMDYNVRLVRGEFTFISIRHDPPYEALPWDAGWSLRVTRVAPADYAAWNPIERRFRALGVAYYVLESPGDAQHALVVPAWLPIASLLIVPLISACRLARVRHRRATGLCLTCGYDLRGSEGRCPECGMPFPPPGE